jgi:hypothetical protein
MPWRCRSIERIKRCIALAHELALNSFPQGHRLPLSDVKTTRHLHMASQLAQRRRKAPAIRGAAGGSRLASATLIRLITMHHQPRVRGIVYSSIPPPQSHPLP